MVPDELQDLNSDWWTRLRDARWFAAMLAAWLDPANRGLWADCSCCALVTAMHQRQAAVTARTARLKRLMDTDTWCECKLRAEMVRLFDLIGLQERDARALISEVVQHRCA